MKPLEKIQLIDKLLLSLNMPNQALEKEWQIEAEDRVRAHNQGQIKSVPMDEVFGKYNR
ncbi:MAG: addiction module protein [Sulfurimonas sp.]